jgi:hypothetical protein
MSDNLYSDGAPEAVVEQTPAKIAPKSQQPKEETLLEKLTSTISQSVKRKDVFIEVPERPGVTLRISPNITQAQMKKWRRECGEDTKNGMDATKFACYVIGHTTDGILMNDEEVRDDSGYELNFASAPVLAMTKASRPIPDAVRSFFGLDPHVEAAALAILDAAGYGDTIEAAEDPTKRSSTD